MTQLTREAIEQASVWMARLWADDVSEADKQAFEAWREQHPANDCAWQQLQRLQQKFSTLPQPHTGSRVLGRSHGPSRRQFLLWGGMSAGTLVLSTRWPQHSGELYTSAVGEQKRLTLADGTRLIMDTDTEVRVDFNHGRRRLYLRQGRVMITTAHHGTPFELETAHGRVVPLGTRFSVYTRQRQTQVAVLEGAVELRPAISGGTSRILAGEQGQLTGTGASAAQPLANGAGLWTAHKLVATGQPLHEFIAELARYHPGVLRADASLHRLKVTGVFMVNDTEAVLRHLAQILPVRVRHFTRYWVRVSAR